jgi:hypothetical protein
VWGGNFASQNFRPPLYEALLQAERGFSTNTIASNPPKLKPSNLGKTHTLLRKFFEAIP